MAALLIGYACCPTDQQDLTAQHVGLTAPGVSPARIYTAARPPGRNAVLSCEAGGPHGDVVDGHPGGQSNHLPGCPFGFANGAALRGSVDFANVDRPAAAVAGDVDIEAGHWSPPV